MELHTRLTEEAMTFEDYLLQLFYLIDSELEAMNLPPLRSRGSDPTLHDSEVITIELAGEFLGIDTDKGIFSFFRRYHRREFPAIARVCRTTFLRQAANLWRVKQLLHQRLAAKIPLHEDPLWLIDSFPLHVCKFARAQSSKLFKGTATYGYDHLIRNTFFGFRVHVRCSDEGPLGQATLAAADVSDLAAVDELTPSEGGVGIGDRNYWGPERSAELLRQKSFLLLAPFRTKSRDPDPPRSKLLRRMRKLVETVIGQLVERFHCNTTRARDLWHLCNRLVRKFLSHAAAVLLNVRLGNPPLQLALLINA
jgi:hypothetical protein